MVVHPPMAAEMHTTICRHTRLCIFGNAQNKYIGCLQLYISNPYTNVQGTCDSGFYITHIYFYITFTIQEMISNMCHCIADNKRLNTDYNVVSCNAKRNRNFLERVRWYRGSNIHTFCHDMRCQPGCNIIGCNSGFHLFV